MGEIRIKDFWEIDMGGLTGRLQGHILRALIAQPASKFTDLGDPSLTHIIRHCFECDIRSFVPPQTNLQQHK
jgi:hypothetical protein